jgi:hypothetical protein
MRPGRRRGEGAENDDGEIWQRFKVTQQSTYVLIDASGNVTFTGNVGGDELHSKVAALAG